MRHKYKQSSRWTEGSEPEHNKNKTDLQSKRGNKVNRGQGTQENQENKEENPEDKESMTWPTLTITVIYKQARAASCKQEAKCEHDPEMLPSSQCQCFFKMDLSNAEPHTLQSRRRRAAWMDGWMDGRMDRTRKSEDCWSVPYNIREDWKKPPLHQLVSSFADTYDAIKFKMN